jgi:hydrogenase expression/formation protein HypC
LNPNGSGRKKKSDEGLFHSFHLFRKIRREIKMCLAIPVLLQKIEDTMGIVEIGGVTRRISLVLTPEAKEGNYVLIHAGYAIGLLDEEEAKETLQLLTEMAAFAEEEDISKKADPA